jgi:hypothetical protein
MRNLKSCLSLSSTLVVGLLFFASLAIAGSAQNINVKIIDRRTGETGYSYQVPGHATSTSDESANCTGSSTNVNCSGSGTTNTEYTAPRSISYSVTGATLSLLLPDGRIAVVNCVSKYKLKMDYVNRRSCRMPIVDDIPAEFSGKSVKLKWPVSLDGKKFDSETYQILAVLPKQ